MRYYFAYGSNMDEEQMTKRCPGAIFAGTAVLKDYTLAFTHYSITRKCGAADIVPSPGGEVYGVLYELTDDHFRSLDRYEGCPNSYTRQTVTVMTETGEVQAEVYDANKKEPEGIHPSREYLGLIQAAATKYHFPETYCALLANTEVQK